MDFMDNVTCRRKVIWTRVEVESFLKEENGLNN